MPSIHKMKENIRNLKLPELRNLDRFIQRQIEKAELAKEKEHLAAKKKPPTVSYQLEYVKCGRDGCKCQRGELHGPYWFGYYSRKGKLISRYIGKEKKEIKLK